MQPNALEDSLADIEKRSSRELWGAFPYGACREVVQSAGREFEALVPDLELWLSDIALHCSVGKGWLQLTNEEVARAIDQLSKSFYERFPLYVDLRATIEANVVLARSIAIYNEYRFELRSLLGDLLISRNREEKCG